MGLSKTEEFNEEINTLADIFKVLGHPARLSIINYLLENPGCICNDIVKELPLSQATISQHLKELKSIGIIKGEILPPKVCYCIDFEKWESVYHKINKFTNYIIEVKSNNLQGNSCC